MIKILATQSKNEDVQKWYGQIRQIVSLIAGVLIALGFLNSTNAGVEEALSILDMVVENTEIIIGLVMQLLSMVGSWFSKEA